MEQTMEQMLVEAAMTFYNEAEAPGAEDFEILFKAIAEHDFAPIDELFDRFGIKYKGE